MTKYDGLEWHEWQEKVEASATEANGFDEGDELDHDKLLGIYDQGYSVEEALELYHTW